MAWKVRVRITILWMAFGLFFFLLFILTKSLPNPSQLTSDPCSTTTISSAHNKETNLSTGDHSLAIIVPFRDRFEELQDFVPHLSTFLNNQSVLHEIFIVNQVDNYRFNRASLINVGFLHIQQRNKFDYVVMHDVDLLPLNSQLQYKYPGLGHAMHIASPQLHPKYHYDTFVGGILLLTTDDFHQLNGLSNKYWGWGLEDDEFYLRMKQGGIQVLRPNNITSGYNTFRHVHDSHKRKRDEIKCYNQKAVSRKRDRLTGLNDVAFTIHSKSLLTVNGSSCTVLNVILSCNKTRTPWCDCS